MFKIIKFKFNDSGKEYYFSTLAAIYTMFTDEQVGVKLSTLWNLKTTRKGYRGKNCTITICDVHVKPQQRGRNFNEPETV